MKCLFTACCFFIFHIGFGQTGTPVLFLTDQQSTLFIDGAEMTTLNVNEPYKIYLGAGDHVAQAKNQNGIVNKVLSCQGAVQIIVSFKFDDLNTKFAENGLNGNPEEKPVFFNTVLLNEHLKSNTIPENKYFSFDANDKIKFNYGFSEAAGTLNLSVYSYPHNQIIYSKNSVPAIADSFTILSKGVYYFSMTSNEPRKRNATLKITRVPAPTSKPDFRTSVLSRPDTAYKEIFSETYVPKKSRLTIPVSIPDNARFWIYWIGIGNEAIINYDNYSQLYADGKTGNDQFALYAYGTGRLDMLPTTTSNEKIDYGFADKINAKKFIDGKAFEFLHLKKEKNVTSGVSTIHFIKNNPQLLISVPDASIGQKIKVVIGAFVVSDHYVVDEAITN
jgi:hypothetical protein